MRNLNIKSFNIGKAGKYGIASLLLRNFWWLLIKNICRDYIQMFSRMHEWFFRIVKSFILPFIMLNLSMLNNVNLNILHRLLAMNSDTKKDGYFKLMCGPKI